MANYLWFYSKSRDTEGVVPNNCYLQVDLLEREEKGEIKRLSDSISKPFDPLPWLLLLLMLLWLLLGGIRRTTTWLGLSVDRYDQALFVVLPSVHQPPKEHIQRHRNSANGGKNTIRTKLITRRRAYERVRSIGERRDKSNPKKGRNEQSLRMLLLLLLVDCCEQGLTPKKIPGCSNVRTSSDNTTGLAVVVSIFLLHVANVLHGVRTATNIFSSSTNKME